MEDQPLIIHLPDLALEKILSFLPYNEIANNRLVCKKFNSLCGQLLTRGFHQVERRHSLLHKRIKSLLPRRESERSKHALTPYSDILSGVSTRISMLSLTFMKYLEGNLCCFFPGKVLDEINRILDTVDHLEQVPRTNELLQELRDITCMAVEHFDESVLPYLKEKREAQIGHRNLMRNKIFIIPETMVEDVCKATAQVKSNAKSLANLSQTIKKLTKKVNHQKMCIQIQSAKLQDQEKKIQEQAAKIQVQDSTLASLKKEVADLTMEFTHAKALLQKQNPHSAKAPSSPSPAKTHRLSMRPRTSRFLSKFITLAELEKKRKSSSIPEVPCKVPRLHGLYKTVEVTNCEPMSSLESMISKKLEEIYSAPISDPPPISRSSSLNSSLENLVKMPIGWIKCRKRRIHEDIDLNQ